MSTNLGMVFLIALMAALVLTPLFRLLAHRFGHVDSPDGRRKHQAHSIPLAGGIAVFFALLTAIGVVRIADYYTSKVLLGETRIWTLLSAVLIVGFIGLIDDSRGLRGRHKLMGQFLAISLLLYFGDINLQHISIFGYLIDLGPFGIFATYAWMLAAINAINLIDGMDGLLGTIGALVCFALTIVGVVTQQWYIALIALALAGSLIGFLWFNRPPASVYLGDCGSMIVGLILGTLALQGSMKAPTALTLAVPCSLLVLPLLDTAAAIARRKLTGRSIFTTDRGHLHHCLLRSGLDRPRALLFVILLTTISAIGAVASTLLMHDGFALASAALVVFILVSSRLFGHAEFILVFQRVRAVFAALRHRHSADRSHQLEVRLQGSAQWQEIWEELTSAAFQFNLRALRLDVNAPALHEDYYARWDRFGNTNDEAGQQWRAELPITLRGQVIGRLTATGLCDQDPIWIKLNQLGEIIRNTELQAQHLTALQSNPATPATQKPLPETAVVV